MRGTFAAAVGGFCTMILLAAAQGFAAPNPVRVGDLVFRGCLSADDGVLTGSGNGACERAGVSGPNGDASGLEQPRGIVAGPEGRTVYVAATQSSAVVRFVRDRRTGALRRAGCITGETESGPFPGGSGACIAISTNHGGGDDSGLHLPKGLAISPNGRQLYATLAGDSGIAIFNRNPKTGQLGFRTCLSSDSITGPGGSNACRQLPTSLPGGADTGISDPSGILLTPDGRHLYVASGDDASVVRMFRNRRTGALSWGGCLAGNADLGPAGLNNCTRLVPAAASGGDGSGLAGAESFALSPDGRQLYVSAVSDDAIVRLFRNRRTGRLTWGGCVAGDLDATPPPAGAGVCSPLPKANATGAESGLDLPFSLAADPRGRWIYAVSRDDDAISRFRRTAPGGKLVFSGCVTGEQATSFFGGSGACAALPVVTGGGSGTPLNSPFEIVAAPDGRSLYVANQYATLTAFGLNRAGAPFVRGCWSGDVAAGPSGTRACEAAGIPGFAGQSSGLAGLEAVAVSPDGRSVYAASRSDHGVVSFRRGLGRCHGVAVTIAGTPGADRIVGTNRRDVIDALSGRDTAFGRGGNDMLCGNGWADRLFGGPGSDFLRGGAGPDRLFGNAGSDRLFGNSGADRLFGGRGRDRCRPGPGRDLGPRGCEL